MTSRPLIFLFVLIAVIALIAGGGYFLSQKQSYEPAPPDTTASTTPVIPIGSATTTPLGKPELPLLDRTNWLIYTDSASGFAIEYPPDLLLSETKDAHVFAFPKNTYFHWPLLDDATVKISAAATCPKLNTEGLNGKTDPQTVSLGGREWKRTQSIGAAAGNIYLTITYDTVEKGLCYHIELLDHGANGAALYVDSASLAKKYDAVHATDQEHVLSVLATMVGSVKLIARTPQI